MDEERYITIKNYSHVWNVDHTIYTIQGVKLWFPVNLKQAGTFLIALAAVFIFKRILPVINNPFLFLLIPAGITWLVTKQKLDGKRIHTWIYGQIQYFFSAKVLNKYRPIEQKEQTIKYKEKMVYRH
jgi:MFS superfamily sulfate permease-like transporter